MYDELYSRNPFKEVADKQIYDFALRCFRTGKPKAFANDVWLFFHYVIGGYVVGIEKLWQDLPKQLALSDFSYWKEWVKATFPEGKYDEALTQFTTLKRNPRLRDS